MSEYHTPLEKHLGQVPQTEFVADTPQHHETHDIGRILHAVEDRASALIKAPLAGTVAKSAVSPGVMFQISSFLGIVNLMHQSLI